MSSELSSLESALKGLRPRTLDPALLDRLEACAHGAWRHASPLEQRDEARLADQPPAAVPPQLMARLEALVATVPFPADRKIVLFPGQHPAAPANQRKRSWLPAAAAVALLGGLAAWFVPTPTHQAPLAADPQPSLKQPSLPGNPPPGRGMVPAGFHRGLSQASDEGVLVRSADEAHRVLKLVYTDRVTLRDGQGKVVEVEQPRVEYILVPTRID